MPLNCIPPCQAHCSHSEHLRVEKSLTFWKKLLQIFKCLRSLAMMFYQTTEQKKKNLSRHNHAFQLFWDGQNKS